MHVQLPAPLARTLASILLLAVGFGLVGGLPTWAQQPAPKGTTVFEMLKEEAQIDEVPVGMLYLAAKRHPERLSSNQWSRLQEALRSSPGGGLRSKVALSDLSIERSLQRLSGSSWPREDINFVPGGNAIPAGDVNGDGVNDWIYRYSSVADDRTADRSARVTKTLLVYGGGDFSSRYYDKLYYRGLTPAGNFVGSENADAYQSVEGGIRIYEGTNQGYIKAGEELDVPLSPSLVADMDGDGYDDLIATSSFETEITVIYGAEDAENVTTKTFEASFDGVQNAFSYGASDIDGDENGEIIRVGGFAREPGASLTVDVFAQSDSSDTLGERQEFSFEPSAQVNGTDFRVNLADVDGSGLEEILLKEEFSVRPTFVFSSSSGSYDSEATEYAAGNGDLRPAGDLNGDGRADFIFPDGEIFAIGLGPENVSDGLTSDFTLGGSDESVSFPSAGSLSRPFGDLNGDGTDDLIAGVSLSERFGSRLVQLTEDRSSITTADFLFDQDEYSGDDVMQGTNVGDWNGDGTDDMALLFRDGRAGIYFGDPAQATSPDVMLTGPGYQSGSNSSVGSMAAGDFTGNGDPNLAVAWESTSQTIAVYEAGDGDSPVQTVSLSDLSISENAEGIGTNNNGPNGVVANLGDVNGDGTADLGVTQPEVDTDPSRKVFLFYGGEGLSSEPDLTIDYATRGVSDDFGQVLRGVGDINGDGTDDFLVGDTFQSFRGEGFPSPAASGALFVHYGSDGGPPSREADEILAVPVREEAPSGGQRFNSAFGFSGIAVGDFNGDGTTDIAAKSAFSRFIRRDGGAQSIRLFYGGSGFDGTPDAELPVPGVIDTFSDTEFAGNSFGPVTALPPASEGGPDRLVIETYNPSNALVYGPGPDAESPLEKKTLLRGPDQRAGLGAGTISINLPQNASSAVGDFNGNGQANLVMPQLLSADFRGTPAYAYELGSGTGPEEEMPVASATRSVQDPAGSSVAFSGTGTSVVFSDSAEGSGDVTVDRFDSRPEGGGTVDAENVSEYRVEISASGNLTVGDSTEVRFDASMLEGISDPSEVTIYTRELSGIGGFQEVSTSYDAESGELVGLVSGFSEFAFGSDTEPLFSYPDRLEASADRAFADASGPGDYRLVALPGRVDTSLAETFSGEAGAQWQAFWDDGSSGSPFVRYDGTETFDFRPGRGFWAVSVEGWSFSDSLQTVPLREGQVTAVPLNGDSTWTIVSNPLGRDVAWRSVVAANDLAASGTAQPLWRFDGAEGFVRADTMASAAGGEAYYFFNATGLDSLAVPYPATEATGSGLVAETESAPAPSPSAASPPAGRSSATELSAAGPSVPLLSVSARPAGTEEPPSTVHVGLSEGETRSSVAPPGRFEPASLRIVGSDKSRSQRPARARSQMVKVQPAGRDGGQAFSLHLTSRTQEPVELSAEGLQETGMQEARLLHPAQGKTYDLREEQTVRIQPEDMPKDGPAGLKLAVGTAAYVEQEAERVLPDEVTLTSYPNPVRRQGTLEYALPEASEVTLKVYDVLGREVATVEQGRKQAGRHQVTLETDRLSSGTYFGRLETGGKTRTQKITVVR